MTWDISGESDQEYFEFVIGEFIPGVQRMGLQATDAWATIYGSYPQIQVGLLASDAGQARRILNSDDWSLLQDRLTSYVKNFSYAVEWELTDVEIVNYDGDAAVASVVVRVMSKPTKQTSVASVVVGATHSILSERWIFTEGQWWFSAKF